MRDDQTLQPAQTGDDKRRVVEVESHGLVVEVRFADEEIGARGDSKKAICPLRVARVGDRATVDFDAEREGGAPQAWTTS